jgi:uncharacterized protein YkwD
MKAFFPPLSLGLIASLVVFGITNLSASTAYSHGDPTDLEQFQLELVNAARANPAAEAARLGIDLNQDLAPGRISPAAKPPLAFHPLLLLAARNHSDWMLASGIFNHTGEGGSEPLDRARAVGYAFGVGENISARSTSGEPDYLAFTQSSHDGLFRSKGHRTNLMEPSYTVVGLGLRTGSFNQKNALMVTQKFSSGGDTVDSGPFLLGVVYDDKNGNDRYDPGEGLPGVRVQPDFGGHHAVTSASGGYAVPLPPRETLTDEKRLSFPVMTTSWDSVRPHDEAFRREKIESSPMMTLGITWSEASIGGTTSSETAIRTPRRINYKLIGTDGGFYSRTMVTGENVQVDFVLQEPPPSPPPFPSSASHQISFDPLTARKFGTAPFRPKASATSGLGVRFSSSNSSVAKIVNGQIQITGVGTTRITARQPGNAAWQVAPPASQTLRVVKGDPKIVFNNPGNKTLPVGSVFWLTARVNSKRPITFTSNNSSLLEIQGRKATVRGHGKVTITATQTGNKNWNSSALEQTIEIKPKRPVITSPLRANAKVGKAFAYWITARNKPTRFKASALPSGLRFNSKTGRISGTPKTSGNFSVKISAIPLPSVNLVGRKPAISKTVTNAPFILGKFEFIGEVLTVIASRHQAIWQSNFRLRDRPIRWIPWK